MTATPGDALRDDPALAEALGQWRDRGRLSNEAVRALKTRRRRVTVGAAVGALAITAAVGVARYPIRSPVDQVAHLETGRGQYRSVRLADGTAVRMNGATVLDIRYTGDRRIVTMTAGQAFFDVAHNAAQPFEVHAGDADIRVLGTAFDVDFVGTRVDLAVHRGAVRLAGRRDDRGERVQAGWRGHVIGGHAAAPTRFDPTQEDWRGNWLDTSDMRLADLVTILNRHTGKPVLAPPSVLADRQVTGRFRLNDPKTLLRAIGSAYGFSIIERDEDFVLKEQ